MPRDWKGGSASTFKTIGASNHCDHDRADNDYYATEPAATVWLCKIEQFGGPILEPSCGEGHISRQLQKAGYEVVSRDLADRGFGEVADFLSPENKEWAGDIVTNPPYSFAQEFVEKSLAIIPEGRKVAMFLKLTFLEGKRRARLFETTPPHSHLGFPLPTQMCHERRLRAYGWVCHRLCLVHLAERFQWKSRNTLV